MFKLKPIEKNIPVSDVKVHSKSEKTLAIEERLLSMTPKQDSFIVILDSTQDINVRCMTVTE